MGKKITRRNFLEQSAVFGGAAFLPGIILNSVGDAASGMQKNIVKRSRPGIYVTGEEIPGLNSMAQLKNKVKTGHAKELWEQIKTKAEAECRLNPLAPASMFPGRNESAAKHSNPDWTVCNEAGGRMLRAALVHLVTGEVDFKINALQQMEALFDQKLWPKWMDQAHERFGHTADLRTGMLSLDVALAFDWLYTSLSESERAFIIDGIDRQGVQPYLTSIAQNPWWTKDLNNWLTVIVGGFGIAGMALGEDHPDSRKLIDISIPLMEKYMSIYGPEGEFNESVAYANATKLVVNYYLALYYWSRGGDNRLAQRPFPETCYWKMYLTLPPGRVAAFGDAHVDAFPEVKYVAAVAGVVRDRILQWFYLQNAPQTADPLQLLWYDPTLEPESPEGKLPLGKASFAHGACVSSRSNWNPNAAACVVYGKAGREENHEHNDLGQVCIDGYGERLVVDLGSPSGYPVDFFDENRWKYYNASILGHNILMFGGRELKVPQRERGEKFGEALKQIQGKIVQSFFDDEIGSYWRCDLTQAYSGVESVFRTVVHFFPGIVAVLDEAALFRVEEISLRWHTINRSVPDESGNFIVEGEGARLVGRVANLNGQEMKMMRNEHGYNPPFDKNRLGEPLEQRNESYVEAKFNSRKCRLLTLFAVEKKTETHHVWKKVPKGWQVKVEASEFHVHVSESCLSIVNVLAEKELKIDF